MLAFVFFALLGGLVVTGCSNVSQMHRKYQEGDESQFFKLTQIVARGDYPYATRKNAARILGEIGESRALPALILAINEYDQRTTLKTEALLALGRIGDPEAVEPIGRLLDRSLSDPNAELRLIAIPVLGQLGGAKSADILVNALGYYDIAILRQQQRVPRGVFTGEVQQFPFAADSSGQRRRRSEPGGGFFGESQTPQTSMFGTELSFGDLEAYDSIPEERTLAHDALVAVGQEAVGPISEYLTQRNTTPSLRKELLNIIEEIRRGPVSETESQTQGEDALESVDKD